MADFIINAVITNNSTKSVSVVGMKCILTGGNNYRYYGPSTKSDISPVNIDPGKSKSIAFTFKGDDDYACGQNFYNPSKLPVGEYEYNIYLYGCISGQKHPQYGYHIKESIKLENIPSSVVFEKNATLNINVIDASEHSSSNNSDNSGSGDSSGDSSGDDSGGGSGNSSSDVKVITVNALPNESLNKISDNLEQLGSTIGDSLSSALNDSISTLTDTLSDVLNSGAENLINASNTNFQNLINKCQDISNSLIEDLDKNNKSLIEDLDKNNTELIEDLDKISKSLIEDLDKNNKELIEDLDKNNKSLIDKLEEIHKILKRIGNLLEWCPERVMKETAIRLYSNSNFDLEKSDDQLADAALERSALFTKKLFASLPFTPKTDKDFN